ncbi:MAG: flagellar biosynthesis protein FliQ [Gammaproteobacteria bacterium]|jgi:flagellar biosynthetic protein FliQ|nr:flagellar biosynthesis protein FliQ [Gammaproteobacteria bacterium]MBT3722627.1 flagellar biosynthesis protein FliQ [Gammaproteobacteria bacterium]MBT4076516.1 flagellar biosynthesis protein FliQ [Gammaproteobacteria bacterium]MBT4193053.1 flagellar biosynthesis protein FliQ [Gammaproteobacteria bacterium]MBT4451462.1 flagellar biosynthesis protein FliQ [Gammaproteobacteria bacterium]
MNADSVIDLSQQALYVIVMLAAPMLISALAIGLLIGMFQAATSINEMTLSFIPKLLVLVIAIMIAGPWMLQLILNFTRNLYLSIPGLIG